MNFHFFCIKTFQAIGLMRKLLICWWNRIERYIFLEFSIYSLVRHLQMLINQTHNDSFSHAVLRASILLFFSLFGNNDFMCCCCTVLLINLNSIIIILKVLCLICFIPIVVLFHGTKFNSKISELRKFYLHNRFGCTIWIRDFLWY